MVGCCFVKCDFVVVVEFFFLILWDFLTLVFSFLHENVSINWYIYKVLILHYGLQPCWQMHFFYVVLGEVGNFWWDVR